MCPNSRQSDVEVYRAYRDEESCCEIAAELGLEIDRRGEIVQWPAGSVRIDAADVHHLFSVSGQRIHIRPNLIALARSWHDRFHSGNHADQVPIRLLCLAAKCAKSIRLGDPSEFDEAELERAAGCSVRGWVECARFEPAWDWCERYRAELLERWSAAL